MNGFRATGLFPFDPNSIPEDAYAPSLLSEIQNTDAIAHSLVQNIDSDLNLQLQSNLDTHFSYIEDYTAAHTFT